MSTKKPEDEQNQNPELDEELLEEVVGGVLEARIKPVNQGSIKGVNSVPSGAKPELTIPANPLGKLGIVRPNC